MLRNTLIGSFLGWCGVSIPNGADDNGLPTAFLISGAPGADQELLAAAVSMESVVRNGFPRFHSNDGLLPEPPQN
jgi:aspartyl-tRNA(Asn)/glutamyl-tRNA(Gln) amidotransferase subunit A